jgi:LPXTG-motif cell wall-anchored protein
MAILKSPHYQGLSIYVGENPIPGAFYCPKSGENLSVIANKAYKSGTITPVLRINKSEWNIANCAYRQKSANCYSKHVDPTLARGQSGWGDGAWIALCQADAQDWAKQLGLAMPVIWIPTAKGEDPDDLAPGLRGDVVAPGDSKEGDLIIGGGDPVPDDNGPMPGSDEDEHGCKQSAGYVWCEAKQRCIRPFEEKCEDEIVDPTDPKRRRKKRAIWPWVLVGGALLAGGIYLATRKKKKSA